MALHFVNNTVSYFLSSFQNRVNAVSALSLTVFIYICTIVLGYAGKKYLDSKGIKLFSCLKRENGPFKNIKAVFGAPAGLTAFYLLLFFAALGSYNNLI